MATSERTMCHTSQVYVIRIYCKLHSHCGDCGYRVSHDENSRLNGPSPFCLTAVPSGEAGAHHVAVSEAGSAWHAGVVQKVWHGISFSLSLTLVTAFIKKEQERHKVHQAVVVEAAMLVHRRREC